MLKLTRRNGQAVYMLIQCLYWGTFVFMFSFASSFLQTRGLSNREIGLVLGCSYACSAVLQPLIAAFFARAGIPTERGLCGLFGVVVALTLLLLLAPETNQSLAVLIVLIFSLYSALRPSVDSLAQRWTDAGGPVDYGAARGVGSLLYAALTAGVGWLLQKITPLALPVFYLAAAPISALFFLLLRPADDPPRPFVNSSDKRKDDHSLISPNFLILLLGISCLSLGHTVIDNFMLQIMQSFGGNSQNQGIAVSIASLVEVPALWLYGRVSNRLGDRKLLVFSGWAWFVKNLLIFAARSPCAIYAAEVLQFCSYAVYTPACVRCVDQWFPPEKRLRGQSLAGSAYTLGSVLAAFAGGALLDALGVTYTLLLDVGVTLTGAILLSLSVKRQKACPVPIPGGRESHVRKEKEKR